MLGHFIAIPWLCAVYTNSQLCCHGLRTIGSGAVQVPVLKLADRCEMVSCLETIVSLSKVELGR